jgi:hypothetical protein
MNAVTTHLDDLLTVLRAAADLRPAADTAEHLQAQVAARLDPIRPELAAVIRGLDVWHAEVLADFLAEAHVVAAALDFPPGRATHRPPRRPPASDDTKH